MKLQHERRLAKGRRGQQVDGVPAVCLRSWPQAMNRLTLVCALLAAVPHVSGCGVAQLTPDPQTRRSFVECREMQNKLSDKRLTAAQASEIMQSMEKAGCLLRGP
jgi:hypothetical protein